MGGGGDEGCIRTQPWVRALPARPMVGRKHEITRATTRRDVIPGVYFAEPQMAQFRSFAILHHMGRSPEIFFFSATKENTGKNGNDQQIPLVAHRRRGHMPHGGTFGRGKLMFISPVRSYPGNSLTEGDTTKAESVVSSTSHRRPTWNTRYGPSHLHRDADGHRRRPAGDAARREGADRTSLPPRKADRGVGRGPGPGRSGPEEPPRPPRGRSAPRERPGPARPPPAGPPGRPSAGRRHPRRPRRSPSHHRYDGGSRPTRSSAARRSCSGTGAKGPRPSSGAPSTRSASCVRSASMAPILPVRTVTSPGAPSTGPAPRAPCRRGGVSARCGRVP